MILALEAPVLHIPRKGARNTATLHNPRSTRKAGGQRGASWVVGSLLGGNGCPHLSPILLHLATVISSRRDCGQGGYLSDHVQVFAGFTFFPRVPSCLPFLRLLLLCGFEVCPCVSLSVHPQCSHYFNSPEQRSWAEQQCDQLNHALACKKNSWMMSRVHRRCKPDLRAGCEISALLMHTCIKKQPSRVKGRTTTEAKPTHAFPEHRSRWCASLSRSCLAAFPGPLRDVCHIACVDARVGGRSQKAEIARTFMAQV